MALEAWLGGMAWVRDGLSMGSDSIIQTQVVVVVVWAVLSCKTAPPPHGHPACKGLKKNGGAGPFGWDRPAHIWVVWHSRVVRRSNNFL